VSFFFQDNDGNHIRKFITPEHTAAAMANRNTVFERTRLGLQEDGWNLAGTESTSRLTRNAGSGRPNLVKRVFNESSSDSDYEADEESSSSEEEEDFTVDDEEADDEDTKPPATRLFLEYESLKKCMEKNCRCQKCNDPVEMKVKTLCIAFNVMVCVGRIGLESLF
jgi:hypothetical protein